MSIDQEPSYPITNKNDIELIRMYMSEYIRSTFSNHLLYFNLSINTGSLYKTFIYWQIYYNRRDYIKLAKLQDMLYPTLTNLWKISNYNIDNDYIYINDVNL